MKKLLTVAVLTMMFGFVYLAVSNSEQGNGQLTYKAAEEWANAENKCPEVDKIKETETGFEVKCKQEFQGLAGEYGKVFHLSYSADPAKPFLID